MRVVGWFQIVVGASILALWTILLATGQVPEIEAGRVDIWFHLAAEVVLAGLLLAAGTATLRRTAHAPLLSGLSLGALAYSAINSPGYYAEQGEVAMVAMFAFVVVASATCAAVVWRASGPTATDHEVPSGAGDAQFTDHVGGAA